MKAERHENADMICAKANDMNLVVLAKCKASDGECWIEVEMESLSLHPDTEHFICLPKHKEACLHWLNGGDVECRNVVDSTFISYGEGLAKVESWCAGEGFMSDGWDFRVKPKKEKRWIAVLPNGRVSGWHDEGKEMLKEQYNESAGWQFIEIEIEV